MNRTVRILSTVLVLLSVPSYALCQQRTGRIDGTVVDQSKAVVPGVTLILKGATIAPREVISGPRGDFHFLDLAPATYTITAKLQGFADVNRENIVVAVGASTELTVRMLPAGVAETVDVQAVSPVVDTKKLSTSTTFNLTQMQEIPTARDPWVLMQQLPGVVVSSINVGGNNSGNQSTPVFGSSDGTDQMWNIDGVTLTEEGGGTNAFYDFDTLQEVQFTTGANDPQQRTGGMGINLVTKRGTNVFHGSARGFFTGASLQSTNVPADLAAMGFRGNKISQVAEYGGEAGGPIVKDKLWGWGSIGRNDIRNIVITGFPDNTQLLTVAAKANWQATKTSQITVSWYRNHKTKQGRNAGVTRPPETTYNQHGPTNIYKIEDTTNFGSNLFVQAMFARWTAPFFLEPQGGMNANTWYSGNTGTYHGSYVFSETIPQSYQSGFDGSYFKGGHELRFGYMWRRVDQTAGSIWPGNKVIANPDDGLAMITRDGIRRGVKDQHGLYVGDRISVGRATISLSARYDLQYGRNLSSAVTANPVVPDLLPAIDYPGAGREITWNNWSPRLGVSFALDKDRKTIARVTFGRYFNELNVSQVNYDNPFVGYSELDYRWSDLNGDKVVQRNEIDFSRLVASSNVDPANPTAIVPPNRIDSNLNASQLKQMVVGIDREVAPAFGVGLAFTYGRRTDVIWTPLVGITSSDFLPAATPVTGSLYGEPYTETWYTLKPGVKPLRANAKLETNRPDFYTYYTSIQATVTKRLQDRWMMTGNFSYNNPRSHYENFATAFQDPTATDTSPTEQNAAFGVPAGTTFINAKWQFNVNGLYELPLGINASANLLGRQGFLTVFYHQVTNPDGFTTFKRVKPFAMDQFRNPNVYSLDVGVDKQFRIQRSTVKFNVDIFNLLNRNTMLQRAARINSSTVGQTQEILSPRVVRFGLRLTF